MYDQEPQNLTQKLLVFKVGWLVGWLVNRTREYNDDEDGDDDCDDDGDDDDDIIVQASKYVSVRACCMFECT